MSLLSVNCNVNQIFPASFTFSMETVQASYCMGVLSLSRVAMIPLFKIPFWEKSPCAENRKSFPVVGRRAGYIHAGLAAHLESCRFFRFDGRAGYP